VGTPDDFEVHETTVTATTAEAYYARSSYEYRFSQKSFAIGGMDWLRNTFSGIDSRFLIGLGAGNTWIDTENTKLETVYGFTYTFESEVVDNPFNTGKFPGLRLSYQLDATLSSTTKLKSRFAGDWNLDNTSDVRVDWTNSVSVSIVSMLALKPSLKLLWRHDPALVEVPLSSEEVAKTAESVFVPLRKLDTFLTLAVVVTL
jgi:putative salt-induced outer membrane protein YdiY